MDRESRGGVRLDRSLDAARGDSRKARDDGSSRRDALVDSADPAATSARSLRWRRPPRTRAAVNVSRGDPVGAVHVSRLPPTVRGVRSSRGPPLDSAHPARASARSIGSCRPPMSRAAVDVEQRAHRPGVRLPRLAAPFTAESSELRRRRLGATSARFGTSARAPRSIERWRSRATRTPETSHVDDAATGSPFGGFCSYSAPRCALTAQPSRARSATRARGSRSASDELSSRARSRNPLRATSRPSAPGRARGTALRARAS